MMRLSLIVLTAVTTPSFSEKGEVRLDHCADWSRMIETIAEARGQYDGLIPALRGIPNLPEVEKFGFDPSYIRKLIMGIEEAHGLTPAELRETAERDCVQKITGTPH